MLNLIRIYFQVSLIDWRKFSCCWMFNLPIPKKNVELKTFRILIEVNKWLLCEWKLNWKNWAFFREIYFRIFTDVSLCTRMRKICSKKLSLCLGYEFSKDFHILFSIFPWHSKKSSCTQVNLTFIFHSSFLFPLLTSWKFKQLVEGKA